MKSHIKRLYYGITDVSRITNLPAYVLRYWESEFEQLRPLKNRAGNRIYTNTDVQTILRIKKLRYEDGYTVEAAKQNLPECMSEPVRQIPEISSYGETRERKAWRTNLRWRLEYGF